MFPCACPAVSENPTKEENFRQFAGEEPLVWLAVRVHVMAHESFKQKRISLLSCHGMAVARWLLNRLQNLGDESSAANFAERKTEEAMTMTIALPKKATLGDLIAAVTDEVSPLIRSSTNTNILVSYIVKDLFAKRRVRLRRRRVLKIA